MDEIVITIGAIVIIFLWCALPFLYCQNCREEHTLCKMGKLNWRIRGERFHAICGKTFFAIYQIKGFEFPSTCMETKFAVRVKRGANVEYFRKDSLLEAIEFCEQLKEDIK